MNIILFSNDEITADNIVPVTGDRLLHIRDVLKSKEGDTINCGIINSSIGTGTIISISRREVKIHYTPAGTPPSLMPVTLIIGMIRPIQAKRVLKTAATYGIRRILWVPTELGEKSYRNAGLWKGETYNRYFIEGASQGGHVLLPEMELCRSSEEAIAKTEETENPCTKIILHPETEEGLNLLYKRYATREMPSDICAAVGSERGWTNKEMETFTEHGFFKMHMGPAILRTEGAVNALLALLSLITGRMG